MEQVRDTKFGMDVSNNLLLNAGKWQVRAYTVYELLRKNQNGLKISQSIIYVREYFCFSRLWLFAQKTHFRGIIFVQSYVNTRLKFLCALGGLSDGNQALGHSEGTYLLGVHLDARRALEEHSPLKALEHLRHLGMALKALGHPGTWTHEALYLADSVAPF